MDYSFLWLAFVALFALVDPLAGAVFYFGLTKNKSLKERKAMAAKACLFSVFILTLFMIAGSIIFDFFSVTIEAFMIGGGLIVARSGYRMLNSTPRVNEEESKESEKKEDVSIVPMAIPMLSGPGAITAVIIWMGKTDNLSDKIGLFFVVLIIFLLVYFILRNAGLMSKLFGKTGTNVVEKIMGLITLVMGVQFVVDAIISLFLI